MAECMQQRVKPLKYINQLGVYQPEHLDTRNILPVKTSRMDTSNGGFAIDSSGGIWAKKPGQPLARFAGSHWDPVLTLSGMDYIQLILPGEQGRMIIRTNRHGYYWRDGHLTTHHTIQDAIADNYDDVAENFTSTPRLCRIYRMGEQAVISDQAGYVWMMDEWERLTVCIDGVWRNCQVALRRAGAKTGGVWLGTARQFAD